jgi:hypothetical protein
MFQNTGPKKGKKMLIKPENLTHVQKAGSKKSVRAISKQAQLCHNCAKPMGYIKRMQCARCRNGEALTLHFV